MPILRLSRVFGVGRRAKAFLNLEAGLTRGVAPDLKYHKEQVKKLRNRIEDQRKRLKRKEARIEKQAQELKKVSGEQRETLRKLKHQRQRNFKLKVETRRQSLEIFQLRNELSAINGSTESTSDVSSAPQTQDKPKTGALPDFVIIGAQKCGTTAFYELLTEHPNVERAAINEVRYFDTNFEKGNEWYRRCFPSPKWKDGQRSITGEKTPNYLFHPDAAERMAQIIPRARLIVLLRNPVDRAYSQYHHWIRVGRETRSFEEAVESEMAWLLREEDELSIHEDHARARHKTPHLLARGIYVDQLMRWSRFFDDEQILVLRSENFFKRTTDTLKLVQSFLDLPYREIEVPPRRAKSRYEPMDQATRRRLEAFFEPHNRRLYEYLGTDFGW